MTENKINYEYQTRKDRITYRGNVYVLPHRSLVSVFEQLGKAFLACEMGVCPNVELVPVEGKINNFKQKCIYNPGTELEWDISLRGKPFVPDSSRCFCVDKTLKEYLEAGILDDFLLDEPVTPEPAVERR